MNRQLVVFFVLLITAITNGWVWGVATIGYKVFPFSVMKYVHDNFVQDQAELERIRRRETRIDGAMLARSAAYAKASLERTKRSSRRIREEIRPRLILPSSLVSIGKEPLTDLSERITARFYGIRVSGILTRARKDNRDCLVVYVQGHLGGPFDFAYHEKLLQSSKRRGCDIFSLSLIGIGHNKGPASFPARVHGVDHGLTLSTLQAGNHANYAFFRDPDLPALEPLALHLSGHYWLIKSLLPDYRHRSMVGFSGGGWVTTMISALLPELDRSVSIAGSLPLVYRVNYEDTGDYEQVFAPFWRDYDYWDMYFLGLHDGDGASSRSVVLIYNDRDRCCFRNPNAEHFRQTAEELQANGPRVIVVEEDDHTLDVEAVERALFNG